jgi:hypothetical protein
MEETTVIQAPKVKRRGRPPKPRLEGNGHVVGDVSTYQVAKPSNYEIERLARFIDKVRADNTIPSMSTEALLKIYAALA